ncbi:hypothetical protein [Mycolicibacterium chlorophenolicum]|uniref:hypothetical protein n=1 Tax=Mycolicibacterium chlorophenolicum TaxID=37916 RepID=UPI0009E786DC|nr:hypothetical protein [Mycolicibacterium chlorophenolicum]
MDFIARVTSRQWTKSACGLCPFAMRTDSGRQAVVGERRIGVDGVTRQVLRERGEQLPALEHFFVVCPAVVEDKARPGFEAWWQEATNDAVLF